jgi:hypothetical protein
MKKGMKQKSQGYAPLFLRMAPSNTSNIILATWTYLVITEFGKYDICPSGPMPKWKWELHLLKKMRRKDIVCIPVRIVFSYK